MIIIFFSVIFFMTALAVVWILPTGQNQQLLPRSVWAVVVLLLPVFAFALYGYLGNAPGVFHSWELHRQEKMLKSALLKIKNPQQLIDRLNFHLKKHADNAQGWYLLGKLYYGQRDYARAVPALKRACQLAPQQMVYVVSYAEASFFDSGQQLKPTMQTLLLRVLKRNKNNVEALNLLAINAYFQGQYRLAIQYWEQLLSLFPVGSKDQQFLLSMISKAQKKEK